MSFQSGAYFSVMLSGLGISLKGDFVSVSGLDMGAEFSEKRFCGRKSGRGQRVSHRGPGHLGAAGLRRGDRADALVGSATMDGSAAPTGGALPPAEGGTADHAAAGKAVGHGDSAYGRQGLQIDRGPHPQGAEKAGPLMRGAEEHAAKYWTSPVPSPLRLRCAVRRNLPPRRLLKS